MTFRLPDIWPDSLLGRLILAILLAAALLYGINTYTVWRIQFNHSRTMEGSRLNNLASFVGLLNQLTPDQQTMAMSSLASSHFSKNGLLAFSISKTPPVWPADASWDTDPATAELRELLPEYFPNFQIRARLLKDNQLAGNAAGVSGKRFPLMEIAIALEDSNWLQVVQPLYVEDQQAVWLQRLLLLAEFVIFVALIVFIVMKVTHPLRRLSRAADFFGRYPEASEPFPETGIKEVREAAQSLNRMRERIEDNLAERNRMLAAMAHDLRTPLTRAGLYLETVEPEDLRFKLEANLHEIQAILEQGLELAGSLAASEELAPLDLIAFVQSLVYDHQAQGLHVTLRESPFFGSRPLLVMARPLCLKRCLVNLLSNAIKYGGSARVIITIGTQFITLDFLDSGPGIPEEYLERVFDPYFRLESSRNRDLGGTGLGLSIARNMALLNNAELTLQNRPEGGLQASLVLPRLN